MQTPLLINTNQITLADRLTTINININNIVCKHAYTVIVSLLCMSAVGFGMYIIINAYLVLNKDQ